MTTRLGVLSQLKPFQPFLFATSLRLCQSLQLYGEAHGFLPRQAEGGGVSPQRQRSAPLALVVCQEGRGAHPKRQEQEDGAYEMRRNTGAKTRERPMSH